KILSSGRDFVNDDLDATDDHGHGTHVAGIAAAESNNNEGIAGVAWNCKILPIKIVDEEGYGDYYSMIEGITYAADNGADVINLSVGGEFTAQTLEEALKYAYDKDIVIIAAVGNEGGAVLFPAAYDDYCLAVAATDYDDIRVDWSNFGPEVDVAAPGERIISLVPTWYPFTIWGDFELPPYGYGFGTSLAAPHVSGFAALIKSIKPWLTAAEIMNIIRYSADDTNNEDYPGKDEFIGYGRINMEKALVPIKITTHK
ncbi:MAG: peptidase S8, partial [Candidatus Aminicenantes bacterium]